MAILFHL